MLSEKRNAFVRSLKNKSFQEERRSKVGLYAIGTSTILACTKSLYGITPSSPRGEHTLLSLRHGVQSGESSKRNSQLSTYQRFTGHYQQPLGHHAGGGGG